MLIDKILIDGKLGNRIKEAFIKKYFNDEWINIHEFSNKYNFQDLKWTNKVFNYMFNITEIPRCLNCNIPTSFRGRIGCVYTECCSNKCSSIYSAVNRMKTLKLNNLKKYGVENVFQLESVKEKSKQTWLDKYGFDNPNKNSDYRKKIEDTNLLKYGVKCTLLLPSSRNNMINKCKENWNNKEWVDWFHDILIKKNGGVGFAS